MLSVMWLFTPFLWDWIALESCDWENSSLSTQALRSTHTPSPLFTFRYPGFSLNKVCLSSHEYPYFTIHVIRLPFPSHFRVEKRLHFDVWRPNLYLCLLDEIKLVLSNILSVIVLFDILSLIQDFFFHGPESCATTQGSLFRKLWFGIMFCCHHLEIRINFLTKTPYLYLALSPTRHLAGLGITTYKFIVH